MAQKPQKQRRRKQRRSAKQEAKAIIRAEYTAMALEMRKRGYTYREIAAEMAEQPQFDEDGNRLNYGIGQTLPQSTLHLWVSTAIAEIPREPAIELRQMHLDRLDTLLQKAWAEVLENERLAPDVLKNVMTLMDRQARYCGLYAPDGAGGGNGTDRVVDAINDQYIEALKADRPILRPDEPPPATPVL